MWRRSNRFDDDRRIGSGRMKATFVQCETRDYELGGIGKLEQVRGIALANIFRSAETQKVNDLLGLRTNNREGAEGQPIAAMTADTKSRLVYVMATAVLVASLAFALLGIH